MQDSLVFLMHFGIDHVWAADLDLASYNSLYASSVRIHRRNQMEAGSINRVAFNGKDEDWKKLQKSFDQEGSKRGMKTAQEFQRQFTKR